MAEITSKLISELRAKTGVGMMDCKKALVETEGDIIKAVDYLRKKGAKIAQKRGGLETNNGVIASYIHPGNTVGVLVEIGCETDFSANTQDLKQFAQDMCMQIAATNPIAVDASGLDPALLEKEREVFLSQLRESGKPEKVLEKILEGKMKKFCEQLCLIDQAYIKNDKISVQDYLNEVMAKVGENIKINRFSRFHIGN